MLNYQNMNSFQVPQYFVDYSQITDSCPIRVHATLKLLHIVIFGWNRVLTQNQKKLNNSAPIIFRQFLGRFSGS